MEATSSDNRGSESGREVMSSRTGRTIPLLDTGLHTVVFGVLEERGEVTSSQPGKLESG